MRKWTSAAVVLLSLLGTSRLFAGVTTTFSPGDILVSELGSSSVQQYSSAGALLRTYTGTGTVWEGASLTPSGQLVTTYRSPSPGGVDEFSPIGTQVLSFTTPTIASQPADLSVFSDGVIAVNNQTPGSNAVVEYSPTGTFVRTITLPSSGQTAGSYVAPNGSLWVIQTGGRIGNYTETGTTLHSFSVNYSGLVDLVVDPNDGTLYVTDYLFNVIRHYSATGTELGNFPTNLSSTESIGIASDNTLYVDGGDSNFVDHYSEAGTLLGSFPLTTPNTPLFLTVVPAAVPEPMSICSALIFLPVLLRRRPRNAME